MSRYTVELRDIVENTSREEVESFFTDYRLEDYLTEQEIAVINERGTWSKERLAQKIVDHYYMREIGVETVGLFKLKAKVAMQEIMEEKLPLIYSAAIKYDPLVNVDYTEEYDSASSSNSTGKSKGTSSGLNVNSDTPQGQINKTSILQGAYASSTGASESEATNEDVSSNNGSQTYSKRVKGNSGVSATAQKMVQQYRENIIMIDRDIIKDLSSLFMGIY
jgi:hypothetical protein